MDQKDCSIRDAGRPIRRCEVYRQVTSSDEVTTYAITAPGWTPERVVQGLNDGTVDECRRGLVHDGRRIAEIDSRKVTPTEWSTEHTLISDE